MYVATSIMLDKHALVYSETYNAYTKHFFLQFFLIPNKFRFETFFSLSS